MRSHSTGSKRSRWVSRLNSARASAISLYMYADNTFSLYRSFVRNSNYRLRECPPNRSHERDFILFFCLFFFFFSLIQDENLALASAGCGSNFFSTSELASVMNFSTFDRSRTRLVNKKKLMNSKMKSEPSKQTIEC